MLSHSFIYLNSYVCIWRRLRIHAVTWYHCKVLNYSLHINSKWIKLKICPINSKLCYVKLKWSFKRKLQNGKIKLIKQNIATVLDRNVHSQSKFKWEKKTSQFKWVNAKRHHKQYTILCTQSQLLISLLFKSMSFM